MWVEIKDNVLVIHPNDSTEKYAMDHFKAEFLCGNGGIGYTKDGIVDVFILAEKSKK